MQSRRVQMTWYTPATWYLFLELWLPFFGEALSSVLLSQSVIFRSQSPRALSSRWYSWPTNLTAFEPIPPPFPQFMSLPRSISEKAAKIYLSTACLFQCKTTFVPSPAFPPSNESEHEKRWLYDTPGTWLRKLTRNLPPAWVSVWRNFPPSHREVTTILHKPRPIIPSVPCPLGRAKILKHLPPPSKTSLLFTLVRVHSTAAAVVYKTTKKDFGGNPSQDVLLS